MTEDFQSSRNFRTLQMFVSGLETSILQMYQMENDLIKQNKLLQERIIILEETQEALENELRVKDLQLQKLDNLLTASSKEFLNQRNTKVKSELEDTTTGNIVIKSEMEDMTTGLWETEISENMESDFQKSSEYFEFDSDSNIVIKDEIEIDQGNREYVENKEIIDELAEPHDWKMKKGKWTVEERIRRRKERRRRKNTEKRNKRILTKLQENNNIWDSDELSFDNNENIRGNRVKEES